MIGKLLYIERSIATLFSVVIGKKCLDSLVVSL